MTNKFECTKWDESNYAERADGAKLAHAKMTFAYTGELEGEGTSSALLTYLPDGSGTATGAELFTGRVNGKEGSVLLHTTNTFNADGVSGTFTIVPGSGTGELADATGEGSYVFPAKSMATDYEFKS